MIPSRNKKIILIVGNSLRHRYIQNLVINSKKIDVPLIIQEIQKKKQKNLFLSKLQKSHLKLRDRYEKKFFQKFKKIKFSKNQTTIIEQGTINKNKKILKILEKIKPDIILCFGCSVLGDKYLQKFKNKILNIHLGLSPFYRGQATNYWAFVNNEPQFIGATFHKIDKGIDTGPIIHQIRGRIYKNDNVHLVGNRVIKDLKRPLIKILANFEKLKIFKKKKYKNEKYYKATDFDDQSLRKLFSNYKKGIISDYLKKKNAINKKFPILENKNL